MRGLLIVCLLAMQLFTDDNRWFFDYELDPYCTNAGFYIGFDDDSIKDVGESAELKIYRELLQDIYKPNVIVLEASISPLPIAGVYYKKHHENSYNSFQYNNSFNLIRSVTEGFDDPYALSLFIGNVVIFRKAGSNDTKNKGYGGLLINVGNKHIRDNILYDDEWIEAEIKTKGDRELETNTLSWGFRVGAKYHSNRMINNTWYVGIKRDFVDFIDLVSWFDNSSVDYRIDFSQKNGSVLKQYLLMEKNIPLKRFKFAFSIGAGFVWDSYMLYNDKMTDNSNKDRFTVMLRPNLKF